MEAQQSLLLYFRLCYLQAKLNLVPILGEAHRAESRFTTDRELPESLRLCVRVQRCPSPNAHQSLQERGTGGVPLCFYFLMQITEVLELWKSPSPGVGGKTSTRLQSEAFRVRSFRRFNQKTSRKRAFLPRPVWVVSQFPVF